MPVLFVGHGNPMKRDRRQRIQPRPAIPINEHYLPLLYSLPWQGKNEQMKFFADRVTLDSLSMRSLWIQ